MLTSTLRSSLTPLRRRLALLAALPLAIMAVLAVAAPAQAQVGIVQPIQNHGNQKCLDVKTEDNHTVQIWNCTGGSEQRWVYGNEVFVNGLVYFEITNQHTGTCMDVVDGSLAVSAQVVVNVCNGSASQQWTPSSPGNVAYLINRNSGLCLDLRGNNSTNGTLIQQYTCNLTTAQFWERGNGWNA